VSGKQSFIAVTPRNEHLRWLHQALKEEGEVVVADQLSFERVLQIVDVTGAQVVFIALSEANLRQETTLIEGLVSAKTLLSVIALADQMDNALLLAAMRAGARDFITTDSRTGELVNLIHRLRERTPVASAPSAMNGRITALVSARPGCDTPMLALHLAIAMQDPQAERHTLLLDLGVPHGDTLAFLSLTSSYSFTDAVRSLRRLDATLIDSAFARHASGLNLLPMPEEPGAVGEITSADIYVLLGTLRRYFSHIVVNLGGVPRSDFLYLLLSSADHTLVVVEQSVPSCRQNMQLVKHMLERKMPIASMSLVIDRYLPKMPPDAGSLAKGFDLPLLATLPPSGMARLRMMNSGEPLFECAPRDPYTVAVRRLAERLAGGATQRPSRPSSGFAVFRSWLGMVRG
jgi:Flp pilus assembly protein, ATPase CpaE